MKRERATRQIGGVEYRLEMLPPRTALRVSAWLLSTYGRPLLSILIGVVDGSIPLAGLLDLDTSSETGRRLIDDHLMPALEALDPDDLDRLAVDLLIGPLSARDDEAEDWAPVVNLDASFARVWDLVSAIGWALVFNFRPTSAGPVTSHTSDGEPARTAS